MCAGKQGAKAFFIEQQRQLGSLGRGRGAATQTVVDTLEAQELHGSWFTLVEKRYSIILPAAMLSASNVAGSW